MLILVINPGATSTKLAVFDGESELFKASVEHDAAALAPYAHIADQKPFRLAIVLNTIKEAGFEPASFAAVSARGGLLRHIPSGTYRITDAVIKDVLHPPYGEHASNLGVLLARDIADMVNIPAFFTDPVSVDEMNEVAHVSGLEGMERESFFHALNQKGMARKAAAMLGRPYEELNLIVVHMGGGVSVAAHKRGTVTDVFNVKDEGSFSMDRGGSLPVNALVNLCFCGKSKAEVKALLGGAAGVFSYLGTRDFREVERRAFDGGDKKARLIFDALAYQHAKDVGAMAAVLAFDVDAVVYTGGMANSARLICAIRSYVDKIAPALVIPGEEEMRSLALGAYRALCGGPVGEYPE